jgi:hypothetical protein
MASGLSYESIGRKVHLSKSAVHRYCTGAAMPREFGTVERIATLCRANQTEMASLHYLWLRATAAGNGGPDENRDVYTETEPVPPVLVPVRRRRAVTAAAVALTIALGVSLVAASAGGDRLVANTSGEPSADQRSEQQITGSAWTLPALPVPNTLFGVTINSGTGNMPGFRVGAVRFWDGGTRWSEIQRQRGEYDWSTLDRLVRGARNTGLPPLFVFGSTPRWARPDGPTGPYPDGTPAPPTEVSSWEQFVHAVVTRYGKQIEAYELWVLANDKRFYAGSVETLVDMTRRASAIIRASDPAATIVCPGMGELWTAEGVSFLRRFAALGGYNYCDVASVKLFQREATDPPETMLDLTATIDRIMHDAGIHPRVWSTGTAYSISTQRPLEQNMARNYAVRFFLVGVYGRKVNLERMYFYNWGGTKIPLVLQPVGGPPTSAALAVEQLQRWLQQAKSRSCGHGDEANMPGNVWECHFTMTESGRTYDATIRWTDRGTATTTAGAHAQAVHYLDGSTRTFQPGETIPITEEPALVTSDLAARR